MAKDANAENRIAWWREARFGMFLHWAWIVSQVGRFVDFTPDLQ